MKGLSSIVVICDIILDGKILGTIRNTLDENDFVNGKGVVSELHFFETEIKVIVYKQSNPDEQVVNYIKNCQWPEMTLYCEWIQVPLNLVWQTSSDLLFMNKAMAYECIPTPSVPDQYQYES